MTPNQKYNVFVIPALCLLTLLACSDQNLWETHGCSPVQEKPALM